MQNIQNEDFVSDVLAYFHNLPGAHLLVQKGQEFAIIYENSVQNYPLWVSFFSSEKDLEPRYDDDVALDEVDLVGWEVVAVK